jgi:hypothetical protein
LRRAVPGSRLSTGTDTAGDEDTIFHTLRDTRPLVVWPSTFSAPAPDPVIHNVPVPVTLRMTCVATG